MKNQTYKTKIEKQKPYYNTVITTNTKYKISTKYKYPNGQSKNLNKIQIGKSKNRIQK